jgi:hypothetical protein
MSRPKGNKKGRTLPMSTLSNGNSDPRIPPDIGWNENDPPAIFTCSQHVEHSVNCDGSCESEVITESQVKLLNEARAWARIPMSFEGVPTCFPDGAFDGVKVDIFSEKIHVSALQKVIIDAGLATQDEIDEVYQTMKTEVMQTIRTEYEDWVRRQTLQQKMALPDKRLLGPDGQVL